MVDYFSGEEKLPSAFPAVDLDGKLSLRTEMEWTDLGG